MQLQKLHKNNLRKERSTIFFFLITKYHIKHFEYVIYILHIYV